MTADESIEDLLARLAAVVATPVEIPLAEMTEVQLESLEVQADHVLRTKPAVRTYDPDCESCASRKRENMVACFRHRSAVEWAYIDRLKAIRRPDVAPG